MEDGDDESCEEWMEEREMLCAKIMALNKEIAALDKQTSRRRSDWWLPLRWDLTEDELQSKIEKAHNDLTDMIDLCTKVNDFYETSMSGIEKIDYLAEKTSCQQMRRELETEVGKKMEKMTQLEQTADDSIAFFTSHLNVPISNSERLFQKLFMLDCSAVIEKSKQKVERMEAEIRLLIDAKERLLNEIVLKQEESSRNKAAINKLEAAIDDVKDLMTNVEKELATERQISAIEDETREEELSQDVQGQGEGENQVDEAEMQTIHSHSRYNDTVSAHDDRSLFVEENYVRMQSVPAPVPVLKQLNNLQEKNDDREDKRKGQSRAAAAPAMISPRFVLRLSGAVSDNDSLNEEDFDGSISELSFSNFP